LRPPVVFESSDQSADSFFKGDHIVTVAENIRPDISGLKIKDYDTRITLGYAIFSVAFLVLIYAASTSAGTAAGDFAAMSVFP
jgi:hypothetical protein